MNWAINHNSHVVPVVQNAHPDGGFWALCKRFLFPHGWYRHFGSSRCTIIIHMHEARNRTWIDLAQSLKVWLLGGSLPFSQARRAACRSLPPRTMEKDFSERWMWEPMLGQWVWVDMWGTFKRDSYGVFTDLGTSRWCPHFYSVWRHCTESTQWLWRRSPAAHSRESVPLIHLRTPQRDDLTPEGSNLKERNWSFCGNSNDPTWSGFSILRLRYEAGTIWLNQNKYKKFV